MTHMVYLAHPVDHVPDSHYDNLRSMVTAATNVLTSHGLAVYDPVQAWTVTADMEPDPRLQEMNDHALYKSDVVLALLPEWAHSVGVPMEIQTAASMGKQVFVVRPKRSWALAGLGAEKVHQVRTVDEAVQGLLASLNRDGPELAIEWWDEGGPSLEMQFTQQGDRGLSQAYPDDAGFDLYYDGTELLVVHPGDCIDVPSGVAVQPPPGVWCFLVGRSSTYRTLGLLVNPAIIDPGYRGELFAVCRNVSTSTVKIEPGIRIAQIVPIPALAPSMKRTRVIQLAETTRGSNGFGSSGT